MDIENRYQATLAYLFDSLPMFQRVGASAYKTDLTNTLALLDGMNHPEKQFPCIHIAGTNGKGSTSHLTASILKESGLKVGLYTSPHLSDFRERICVNGAYIDKRFIVAFFDTYTPLFEQVKPSFFEMTFVLACAYFAYEKVDMAVIETGLGGRLDATNIVTPLLSVITNIGYDHKQFLGDTLHDIATEKAGIIKHHTPVVIGETHPMTQSVFVLAAEKKQAPIIFADQTITLLNPDKTPHYLTGDLHYKEETINACHIPLLGNYQYKNIKTVLQTIVTLTEQGIVKISTNQIKEGIKNLPQHFPLKGRWQQLNDIPLTIADIAHNVDGVREIIHQLMQIPHQKLHMVWGMVNDKDIDDILDLLPLSADYYFCQPSVERRLPVETLALAAKEKGLMGNLFTSVEQAYAMAKKRAGSDDIIYIGGSTFVVADIHP